MDVLGVIQIASVGGVCAVVFLVLLPGSFLGLYLWGHSRRAGLRAAGALTGLIMLCTALFSAARIRAPQPAGTIPVTLIATNQYDDGVGADWTGVWATYRPAVIAAATSGGLVVLPEKVVLLKREDVGRAAQDVLAAARETGAAIVVGLETHDHGVYSNRALLVTPDGGAHWYDTQRLVLPWEARDTPGDSAVFADVLGTRLGIAICKDMHVPAIGRQYAGKAALMVVPAYDFGRDGWMGARMTALRAVENGYAIARSARSGLLSAYDRTGRVILERPVERRITVARTVLSTAGGITIYARVGDIFGWLCVTGTVLLWSWLRLAHRVVRADTESRAT
jgi:apolipoprotein N-acyltransferase